MAVVAACCILAAAILAAAAFAAAGDLDQGFSGDGKKTFGFRPGAITDNAFGVVAEGNGKIVVGGYTIPDGIDARFAVARLNPGGGFDQTFAGDGRRTFLFGDGTDPEYGAAIAVQPNGRILIVGSVSTGAGFSVGVARLKGDGTLDHSFAGDGRKTFAFPGANFFPPDDEPTRVAVQSNGKIVIAGYSARTGGARDMAVARLKTDGSFDHTFSADGRLTFGFGNGARDDEARGLAIQPDGRIVLGGLSVGPGPNTDFAIARLNPGGGFDQTFSGDGRRTFGFGNGRRDDFGNDLALQGDGRAVIVGQSYQAGKGSEWAVARLTLNGGLDPGFSGDGRRIVGFGNGGKFDVAASIAPAGGRIVLAGLVTRPATFEDFAAVRLNGSGGLDPSFSGDGRRVIALGGGSDQAGGVAIQRNGRIVVAGETYQGAADTEFGVVRLLGD